MAAALMIVGTGSSAGKSTVVAGLLRIARNRGIRAAPFKAQNMALNSHVTIAGEEIGRSQALQARAARIDPDWRLNPVLLKPMASGGSQVILRGRPLAVLSVQEYYARHDEMMAAAREAYDNLARDVDLVILEGAGSPAEINLWHRDIVNMPMAAHAGAPTVLVADIDRGGSFASIYGTWALFPDSWKALLRGYIFNRFRGDSSLLQPGIDFLREKSGLASFGILPYRGDLGLPEEDSLAVLPDRASAATDAAVSIAVVRLPHMANFTDFDPFRSEPDVALSFISLDEPLTGFDVVVLPGSRGTVAALQALHGSAFPARLEEFRGTVVGVCGGLQMLGNRILDPDAVEGPVPEARGLQRLALDTVFRPEKTLRQAIAVEPFYGTELRGYEIHHGDSGSHDVLVGTPECFGTYVHGCFDEDNFRHAFLADVYRRQHGRDRVFTGRYDIERNLEALAAVVEEHVDVDALFGLRC